MYPAQIIEEIKRKTINEEIVSYIILLPDKGKTEVLIEELSADVFTSIEDLEKKMMENASNQIKKFLEHAKKMESVFTPAKEMYDNVKQDVEKKRKGRKKKIPQVDENKVEIDLGNGLKASMDTSQINQINI